LTGPGSPAARLRNMEQQERLNNGTSNDLAARLPSTLATTTAEKLVVPSDNQNTGSSNGEFTVDLEAGLNEVAVPGKDAVAPAQSRDDEEKKATAEGAEDEQYVERIDGEEEVSLCILSLSIAIPYCLARLLHLDV